MSITILGLGPGRPDVLTRESWEVLERAKEVILRTQRHPTVAALPGHLRIRSFDHLYETLPTFPEVYQAIAHEVVDLGERPEGVIYAVPGHPWVGESTTPLICRLAEERSLPVRIVEGLSFLEPMLTTLGLDPIDGLQVVDAMILAAAHHPSLNVDVPTLIAQCYDRSTASDVKLTLLNAYPDDHPVTVISAAGTDQQRLLTVPLHELDRGEHFDHLTSLYVPPAGQAGSYESLQEVVAHLRAPEGCPWDREQTHRSLRSGLLEESYELLSALDAEDPAKMCEELGDMLLQLLLHIQIATEEGEFNTADVISSIVGKLKRRHPHVFAGRPVTGMDEVLGNWEDIKRQERGDGDARHGLLEGLPATLPALAQAQAYQRRLARVGFRTLEALDLGAEELAVAKQLLAGRDGDPAAAARVGRRLLALTELARQGNMDLEDTLRTANARLAERFLEKAADG
jgi:tetrapyrrole methylase family protein/MazG family protein